MFAVLCIVLIATLPCVPDMEQPERLAYYTLALGNITPSESFKGAAFVIEPRRNDSKSNSLLSDSINSSPPRQSLYPREIQ